MELKTKYEVGDVVLLVKYGTSNGDPIFGEEQHIMYPAIIRQIKIGIANKEKANIEYVVQPFLEEKEITLCEQEIFTSEQELNEYVDKLKQIK